METNYVQLSEQQLSTLIQNAVNTALQSYVAQNPPVPTQQVQYRTPSAPNQYPMLPSIQQNAPCQYPSDPYSMMAFMMMMNFQQQRQYQAQLMQQQQIQQQQFQRMMQIAMMNQKRHGSTSKKICDVLSAGGTFLSKLI